MIGSRRVRPIERREIRSASYLAGFGKIRSDLEQQHAGDPCRRLAEMNEAQVATISWSAGMVDAIDPYGPTSCA